MEMTRGGINGIITGPTVPSAGAVKLLEMLVMENGGTLAGPQTETTARQHVAEIEARFSGAEELTNKLNEIHQRDPKLFDSAKTMIESFHLQVTSYKSKPSSKVQRAADLLEQEASKKIRARREPAHE